MKAQVAASTHDQPSPDEGDGHRGLYVWTAKVGTKGQIVLPKESRDVFNIASGDTVLLLGDVRRGIALLSGAQMEEALLRVHGAMEEGSDLP
ncbi:AbrB/MazE/SpoVT family DNA-binding domain-containing protein [Olsenella massiliensis]|uniref:AbrB/MazE/SpoVT family DNA-binding domain-containing protein n=1 Tax=Olsenella massiliensis TaxID=1622075 RepID=UPI00071CE830|nr:AbrB/MazE/SpoVT family DNA-binding domain-containing protein [Olsenella massiliensis]